MLLRCCAVAAVDTIVVAGGYGKERFTPTTIHTYIHLQYYLS